MANRLRSLTQNYGKIEQLRNLCDKTIRKNEFGSICQIDIPIERLVKNNPQMPRRPKQLNFEQTDRKTLNTSPSSVIECSNPHFIENSKENGRLALYTRYWEKGKYKDQWIKIKKTISKSRDAFSLSPQSWNDLVSQYLHPSVVDSLVAMGCRRPTELQSRMARYISSPQHLFLAAETGSGKTFAYAAPIVSALASHTGTIKPKAVILVSTTLLARQIAGVLRKLAENTSIIVRNPSSDSVTEPWDILVGTPGSIVHALKKNEEAAKHVAYMVLEEADILLDESFADRISDVLSIIPVAHSELSGNVPNGAKVIFCAASCTEELECLAESVVDRHHLSYVRSENIHKIVPAIDITLIRVREQDKIQKLIRLLDDDLKLGLLNQTLVFCKDKNTAKFVHETLKSTISDVLLWDNTVKQDLVEQSRVFVATDVAARGVDLPRLNHVIHYDMARHVIDFLHRSGRVGRLSSLFPCRVTAFVRRTQEVLTAMKIETAARTKKPLRQLETDIAGMIKRKKEERDE